MLFINFNLNKNKSEVWEDSVYISEKQLNFLLVMTCFGAKRIDTFQQANRRLLWNQCRRTEIQYRTIYLRTLKSWRDNQLSLAHGTEIWKKNE